MLDGIHISIDANSLEGAKEILNRIVTERANNGHSINKRNGE